MGAIPTESPPFLTALLLHRTQQSALTCYGIKLAITLPDPAVEAP